MTRNLKAKLADHGSRIIYNLTWLSLVWFVVGAMAGMTGTMFFKGMHDAAMVVLLQWRREAIIGLCILVLSGRVSVMARRPRIPPLDYTKLTVAGGFYANLITISYIAMIFFLVFGLAPDVFQSLVKLAREF